MTAIKSMTHRPKIGLALGSGVARGWAHIGILRAMEEHGIKPDVIAGTSIGAVVGGAYVTGALDDLEVWARELKNTNFFRYLGLGLGNGGLFSATKLQRLMNDHFGDKTFKDADIPFVALACELITGHEIWLKDGSISEAVHASFALPGVFEPVHDKGRWLVDGALVNPVPVSVCRAMGAEMVIAVNLAEDVYGRARATREGVHGTGPYGVFSDENGDKALSNGLTRRSIIKRLLNHKKGAPSLFANMVASLNVVQNRLSRSRLAGDPPDIAIAPKCGHIGLMEFHRADELINIGRDAFKAERDLIEDALSLISYKLQSRNEFS